MELSHVGSRCAFAGCGKQDFLPFKCSLCSGTYCLTHAAMGEHGCASRAGGGLADRRVVSCPLCAASIELQRGEDINETWARHERTACRPSERVKRTKKPRCPVKGCREKLTISNTVRCRHCAVEHCMTHRAATSHACIGSRAKRAAAAQARAAKAKKAPSAAQQTLLDKLKGAGTALKRGGSKQQGARGQSKTKAKARSKARPTAASRAAVAVPAPAAPAAPVASAANVAAAQRRQRQADVDNLTAMGFPRAAALKALADAGGNAERAVAALLSAAPAAAAAPAPRTSAPPVPPAAAVADSPAVAQLVGMGFARSAALFALEAHGGNVEGALSLLVQQQRQQAAAAAATARR